MTRTLGPSAVVLGARRIGAAIVDRLITDGWRVTAVARSEETVQAARTRGARAVRADVTDPDALSAVLAAATDEYAGLDLIVNAAAGPVPPGPFGGGPIADADLPAFRRWAVAVAERTFVFLNAGAVALRRTGGGALIQLTGGSSVRAQAGRGPWAAGAFATRALTQAAALELRDAGIHVALLIVDGAIGPHTAIDQHNAIDQHTALDVELPEIAAAVAYLATPGEVRRVHELRLGRR
ncbi:SDR family oxidoreductase [Planosporangium thailandense]|uniref:SDR family oxidoreductase n=1 Tax=Planosporangium thailandense TaxID=765197 RepID=A0ABX0Y7F4_9ACTN|nr:SDR family oxidoreductase [Planosporangium thailandense]NJC74047.1 SDR family oxidoreductase [Planosporangium thailandense]